MQKYQQKSVIMEVTFNNGQKKMKKFETQTSKESYFQSSGLNFYKTSTAKFPEDSSDVTSITEESLPQGSFKEGEGFK